MNPYDVDGGYVDIDIDKSESETKSASAKVQTYSLARQIVAEAFGTIVLLTTVVGSGIMAESLADGNGALAMLTNTIATSAMLVVLVKMLMPVSGAHFNPVYESRERNFIPVEMLVALVKMLMPVSEAHFNPVVSLAFLLKRQISLRNALIFVIVQVTAAIIGVLTAHVMFDQPLLVISKTDRGGPGHWLGEFIATFGLMAVVMALSKNAPDTIAMYIGLYIISAAWFTSSTCFANPAVTVARMFTHTGAGIQPKDVPLFVVFQVLGGLCGTRAFSWLMEIPSPAVDSISSAIRAHRWTPSKYGPLIKTVPDEEDSERFFMPPKPRQTSYVHENPDMLAGSHESNMQSVMKTERGSPFPVTNCGSSSSSGGDFSSDEEIIDFDQFMNEKLRMQSTLMTRSQLP